MLVCIFYILGKKKKRVFSRFCFIHGLSNKEYKVWCSLGSPPSWAAWARLGLALLPLSSYYELQQHLLLYLSTSFCSLCTISSGSRGMGRTAGVEGIHVRQIQILRSKVDADGVLIGPWAGSFWVLLWEKWVCRKGADPIPWASGLRWCWEQAGLFQPLCPKGCFCILVVPLSSLFHRILRTALQNSTVAQIPTCLLQWMEILNVINLEEKSSKINSIPRLETAFLDCSINMLLWKKKISTAYFFLENPPQPFLQGALKNTCSEHLPGHLCGGGKEALGWHCSLQGGFTWKCITCFCHSFGKLQALFIGGISGGK